MSEQFDGIFSELSKAGYFKTIKDINQALSTKVPNSEKGSPYGVAPLDQNRLIPTIHLPSYVDDVLEYSSMNAFPTTGESSKIYVALDKNKIYRWSGSTYIEISPSPGSTDSIPEGTVNLYFTDNRARAAVTTISGNAGTATKLQTARTITLSGDVGGTVTFDGGSNVTMVTTVGDDSHRHSVSTIDGVQPLNSNLTSIGSIVGNGVLGRDSLGAWSFSDGVETAFSSVPRIYLGSSPSTGIDCNDLGYGVAVVRIGSNSSYNTNKPQFKVTQASYAYIQTIRGFDAQSGNGKIQIAWPLNVLISTSNPVTGVMAFRSVASNSITFSDWEFIVCNMATTSDYGYMTTAQVAALNTAVSSINALQTSKEDSITTLPVSKGGTGVNTLSGIAKFNGTSAIQAATSADIVALVPDATTTQSGKMTTAQVSSLNELGGLVSMGSGIVKKSLSTAGLDTYSTATINDLVTSTNVVSNLNADLLDGNHASAFALSGHSHGTLDLIAGTGVGLLAKTSTSGVGTYSSAQIASLTTTGLTVASMTTNGMINLSLDAGLDSFAGFSDNSANVGLVKLSAVNSFAKATSNDIVALMPDATTTQAGKMTTSQVTALNTAVSSISTLQTAKEDSITTLSVSKGGTGVNTLTGIPKFDGTSAIQAATSNDIVALMPDATTTQAGKMTTSQVSSLNELGGLVSMGSGIVKKTLSTSGLDTYSTAVINDLVTSTTLVPNLNADLLDGKHAGDFSLSGHSHGTLDLIAGTGVGLLAKTSTSTSGVGTYSSAQIASLTTTGLTVASMTTNGMINLSLDTGLDNFAGFSDNSTNVGLVKLSAVNSFAKATSNDIVALMPDATTTQAGKMTTSQVSSLNELSGLVSMGSGIVKKTLSTNNIDTYSTASILDLVTSSTLVPNLNADLLDGKHASEFSLIDHSHDIATASSSGFLSAADAEKLNALTVSRLLQVTTVEAPPANTVHDLNNFISNGFFHHVLDSYISAGLNYPVPYAGMLKVTSSYSMVYQWYHTYNNKGVYFRSKYNSTWYPWSKIFDTVNTSSNDIVALVPDATASQAGKMTTSQVSSLNELGGLVSMGSGIVKKTLSTAGLDTYSTAVITDLVTSTTLVPNLNADLLDGKHAGDFSLSGHSHGTLDLIAGTGVGLLAKTSTSTSGVGTYSSAQIASLTTTGLTVSGMSTNGLINLSLDTGLDNLAGFSDNSANVGLVKLSAVNSFAKATSNDIVALMPDATTTQAGKMTTSQVTSLNAAVSSISTLQSSKEDTITTLPVSKGGTGVNTLSGIAKFNGTSAIQAATSNDIVALMPDATASQAGKMTTAQVSSLNELGGLVSMGSGIVKKTLSTAGLDTYSTASISDLVTSTNVVSNLNADMLDGFHVGSAGVTSSAHIPYVGGDGVIELGKYIDFHLAPGNDYDIRLTSALNANGQVNIPNLYLKGGTITSDLLIWHSGNDGAGSGLDADLFDGIDSTGFLRSNAATMYSGNTLTMATNLKYTPSSTLTTQGVVTYGVEDDTSFCRLRSYGRDASNAITGARFGWSTGTRYINIDTKPDPILSAYDCINIFPSTASAQVALRIDGNMVWHEGNDGPGSGLNADLVDNIHGTLLVRNDLTNQELKGFSLGAPAGTSLSNGIVFNRGLDNASGWSLKSSGTTASPVFTLVDTFTDNILRLRYEWSNAAYYPTTTNTISLGSSSSKWTVVYATTGTINTSDARMKTSVEPLTQNEIMASKLLADEIGLYKFLDSISTKGDQARRHVGMTVQRAIEIMTQCGLEPFEYGFICYDEWVDDSGETQSQYAFRYDQLNMFIIRGLSERIKALESR